MDIRYNKESLTEILEDVYQLIKTPISIFDGDFRYVTSYPSNEYLTDYCIMIRQDKSRYDNCMKCDSEACRRCKESGEGFSYICHGNLLETITPIRFEALIIGYIIFGQYKTVSDKKKIAEYAKENSIDEQSLINAYNSLTVLTERQVEAVKNVLSSCILKFWLCGAISLKDNELAVNLKNFIENNINEKITADTLCKNFFISKHRLYEVFRQNFNMTVKEYILKKKIEKAKELLKQRDCSVSEIAEKTGFSDYNNFIQRFKKITGLSPLQFKKKAR